MSKSGSPAGGARGGAKRKQPAARADRARQRPLLLEALETRALLTGYVYPYGAMPDDTGEYMLGDVAVNVVLFESDRTLAPYDNLPAPMGIGAVEENWTPSSIAAVKAKVEEGLQWWKDTLVNVFPSAPANLLNFHINYQYADSPVHTGYEPIARVSSEFQSWMYDFLDIVGFDASGNFSSDVRAYNDFTRQQTGADWAFTIFVVNNANDFALVATSTTTAVAGATQFSGGGGLSATADAYNDKYVRFTSGPLNGQRGQVLDYLAASRTFTFAPGTFTTAPGIGDAFRVEDFDGQFAPGGFAQAFSFSGGRFMVVPASRPASTIAHEAGHQFWAYDEYDTGNAPYYFRRGYYNSENTNSVVGRNPGYVQQPSIMAKDIPAGTNPATPENPLLSNAYAARISSQSSLAMIGWQDSDGDGIFDVLDVPFSLSGSGKYDATTGKYTFTGSTKVNTLPNLNTSGLQNDITINQITAIQYAIDTGPWVTMSAPSFPPRTYVVPNVTVEVPVGAGIHTVRIRSIDLRTGVTSNEFVGDTDGPTNGQPGVSGIVFSDENSNGDWDSGEPPLPDIGVEITNDLGEPLDLVHVVEPNDWPLGQVLNTVEPGGTLRAIGAGVIGPGDVFARSSTIASSAGKAFAATNTSTATWNANQQLRVDFDTPVSTVSLRAFGSSTSPTSFGRLDAYNAVGEIIARYTTGGLTNGSADKMIVVRTQGDIKYVIAYGHLNSDVVLDTLQWGPVSTPTTNLNGEYSLGLLPDGTYHVHVSPPAGYLVSTPAAGYAVITVSGGQTLGSVNFGLARNAFNRFHNYASPTNVNNDAKVTAIDALMIINFINSRPAGEGEIAPANDPNVIGFIDVTNDGRCAPNDVLAVINYINARPHGSGEGGEGEQVIASSADSSRLPVPRNAAEYYAQKPLQILNIRGTEQPCSCAVCVGARTDLAITALESPAASSQSASSDPFELLGTDEPSGRPLATAPQSTALAAFTSRGSLAGQQRARTPLGARKPTGDELRRLPARLEESLDWLAADLAQDEKPDADLLPPGQS